MSSRRKFLSQGSLTAALFMVTKPMNAVANSLGSVTGFRLNNKKLALLHTGNKPGNANQTILGIKKVKNQTANLLVLHAGNSLNSFPAPACYDASMVAGERCTVASNDYRIIYRGDIKTGVISAESGSPEAINDLAVFLKTTKNCDLVVCMSQLGFRSKNKPDDLKLAAASTHLDIIVGGHAKNFSKAPFIAWNKNNAEVIINHTANNSLADLVIELEFDDFGKKKAVAFTQTA